MTGKRLTFKNRSAKRLVEGMMNAIFFLCGTVSVLCAVALTMYILLAGLPGIRQIGLREFLLGTVWAPTGEHPSFGVLPMVLSSLWGTLGAVLLGVPIGVLTAVSICYLLPKRLSSFLTTAVEILAGIPSVVFGLVGMTVLAPAVAKAFHLPSGANLLSAILVLSVMILPTIVSTTVSALKAVPREYADGSHALGGSEMDAIFKLDLLAARTGIVTGVVLGMGRAMGETMAVLMVSGNVANLPGLFTSVRFLTTGIVSEMGYAAGLHQQALFSIGLLLFVLIFFVNLLVTAVLKGGGEQDEK